MEGTDLVVERLKVGHSDGVRRLFIKEYGRCLPGFPVEKYRLNEASEPVFSHVILHRGVVVGFYGVEVIDYQKGTERIRIAQGCEFLIDPAWRGKGFFQLVYKRVVEELQTHGIYLIIGFQSESSRAFCLRVGWEELGRMVRFHLEGTRHLWARIVYHAGAENWKIRRMQRHLQFYATTADWNVFNKEDNRYTAVYDHRFFGYKMNGTYFTVLLEGCVLLLKYNRYLEVGYCSLGSNADVANMLKKLQQIARKLWVHEVVFQLAPYDPAALEIQKYLEKFPAHYLGYGVFDASYAHIPDLLKINYLEADTF